MTAGAEDSKAGEVDNMAVAVGSMAGEHIAETVDRPAEAAQA